MAKRAPARLVKLIEDRRQRFEDLELATIHLPLRDRERAVDAEGSTLAELRRELVSLEIELDHIEADAPAHCDGFTPKGRPCAGEVFARNCAACDYAVRRCETHGGRRAANAAMRRHVDGCAARTVNVDRPQTRGDCRSQARPCPWISCEHHLLLEIATAEGNPSAPRPRTMRINAPMQPGEIRKGRRPGLASNAAEAIVRQWIEHALLTLASMAHTCALDVVEANPDGVTSREIGELLGVTEQAVERVPKEVRARGAQLPQLDQAHQLAAGSLESPTLADGCRRLQARAGS